MALIQLDREKHEYTDPLNKENAPFTPITGIPKGVSLMQLKSWMTSLFRSLIDDRFNPDETG